ncbi:MAG: lipase/acyltransferase domain-containing protein [Pseudonocardiaceae bacterium]
MAEWRHLIVVLPGIGGSVLTRPGKPDDVVWDAGKGDIADLVLRPARMSVAESPQLEPRGLTESTKFLGFTVVPGYERLLAQLGTHGTVDPRGDPDHPVPGATVVAVPYDFRHSVVEAAERVDAVVCAHLAGASQAERAGRVIVVAHSMGGLVARVWMGLLGRWPWCRALITLGTPHRGAPKALDWLVNGVRLLGCELSRPTELLRGWPSVAELLPRYQAVWDSTAGVKRYPHELPIPALADPAKTAFGLHRQIEQCWRAMPRGNPDVKACLGWSHPTLNAAFWDGQHLEVTKEWPDWLKLEENWQHDFGDGTVPSFSAVPIELSSPQAPDRLAERHVPIACSSRIMELLAVAEGWPSHEHVRGAEREPAIGLDLDEVQAAREPIAVQATLREVDADVSGQAVWALLRPHGDETTKPAGTRLDWDSKLGGFRGLLPGQAEGLYDVKVLSREAPTPGIWRPATRWRWSPVSRWAPWSLDGEPLALRRYVLPSEVARHLLLPGRSGESRLTRLRTVYAALADLKIGYAHEAPADEAGRQVIRPPDQVLWAPKHGTCLDLALVLAGACITAGLHPAVVILARPERPESQHALLLVRLDHNLQPSLADAVWPTMPATLPAELQRHLTDQPGDVLAIDPMGVAVSLGSTPTRGLDVSFDDAVASGARYLTGTEEWVWKVGVDVGAAWRKEDVEPLGARATSEPLRPPYRKPDTEKSPLRLLRAEYQLVRFQNRDELTVLHDFCRRTAAGDRTGLAVITGIGGCGKTRLALELAERLRTEGWYAGTLPKDAPAQGVEWLAGVVSPVLVVLDYADGRVSDATALLKALRARGGPPAVVLLTARAIDGDWLATIVESLGSDAHSCRREDIALPDTHPHPGDVYHRAVAALTTAVVRPPTLPQGIRWTTLDYVLLGWIAAQGVATLPKSREELYDLALEHEQNYWCTVYRDTVHDRKPRRARLRKAAACLSLVAAPEQQADTILTAVRDLDTDRRELQDVRDTLITCLRPAPGEGLALRPDPVGDHLLLRELGGGDDLLVRVLDLGGEPGLEQALVTLVRVGQSHPDAATRLITMLLDADIARLPAVLSIAATQGGAAASSLEQLASRADTPLPLEELSAALPYSSLGLYQLALLVDQRLVDTARSESAEPAKIAELLLRLSTRAGYAGDRAGALESITEAVTHYRQLAQASPAAYLPNLAMSLNNLSDRLADSDQASAIPTAWDAAIGAMAHPAAQAELRAVWARRLAASEEESQQAWTLLRRAATEADLPFPGEQPPDRTSVILAMRARQAVRSLAQQLRTPEAADGLPVWARAPLPDAHLHLVNAYGQAADWPAAEETLNNQREILTTPQFRTTLTALAGLYLTSPVPGRLLELLDEIDESGVEATFARHRADHDRRALLSAWVNTPTWTESLDYYRQHHTDLTTTDTRAILADIDDDDARQHLAILDLTGVMPAQQVYTIVTDSDAAEDAALHAIERADFALLAAVATAAGPTLESRPATWGLVWAVLLLAADQPDSAHDLAHQLAEQASPLQRRAHTIRLHALRAHHPGLAGLDELIEIITLETAAS